MTHDLRRDALAESLNDTLAGVLDEARQLHHDSASDETFTSCALCCGWEGDHSPLCPVKAIATWLDSQVLKEPPMIKPYYFDAERDPHWFFEAQYTDGTRMTFWNDSKALAEDHAWYCGREAGKVVKRVTRLKHAKDVTLAEAYAAGLIR